MKRKAELHEELLKNLTAKNIVSQEYIKLMAEKCSIEVAIKLTEEPPEITLYIPKPSLEQVVIDMCHRKGIPEEKYLEKLNAPCWKNRKKNKSISKKDFLY